MANVPLMNISNSHCGQYIEVLKETLNRFSHTPIVMMKLLAMKVLCFTFNGTSEHYHQTRNVGIVLHHHRATMLLLTLFSDVY